MNYSSYYNSDVKMCPGRTQQNHCFYCIQISRQLSKAVVQIMASAVAIMLLQFAVFNYCIFCFFYGYVELEFLFLQV